MVTESSESAQLPLIVLKVGTRVLVDEHGELRVDVIQSIAGQIKALQDQYRFVVVTSGAISKGKHVFEDLLREYGDADERTFLMFEQMCSGTGMIELLKVYQDVLRT